MKIRTKLLVAMASPLVMLAVLAAGVISSSWNKSADMERIERLTRFATTASSLIHETQKERGATGGFLGGSGNKFEAKLAEQRNVTDQSREEFNALMAQFDVTEFGEAFASQVDLAVAELQKLDQKRREISARSIAGPEAIAYFTNMNATFLDAVSKSALATSDGDIAVRLSAYSLFLKSKERAGIERAVITNTFAKDRFAPGMYDKFISLVSAQGLLLQEFLNLAGEEDAVRYSKIVKGEAVDEVLAMRQAAIDKASSGVQFGLGQDPVKWFEAATARINLLKEFENTLVARLGVQTHEKAAAARASLWTTLFLNLGLGLAITVGGFIAVQSILRRVGTVTERIRDLADGEGDLTKRLEVDSDEIGEMCGWFNALLERIEAVISRISVSASTLAHSSEELASTAASLETGARSSKDQSVSMSSAIEQLSANMNTTAASSEEMSTGIRDTTQAVETIRSSIQEIASRTSESATMAQSASESVSQGQQQISELKEAATEIGHVLDMIHEIAEQTNLLALNATIEAARAGEAGKGFSVVATEVKELAAETAKATDVIRRRVEAIQGCTHSTIDSMTEIDSMIQQLRETGGQIAGEVSRQSDQVTEIAAAMRQSSTVTDSISRSVAESAATATEMTRSVVEVDRSVSTTANGAELAHNTSCTVSDLAAALRQEVGQFKTRELAAAAS